MSRFWIALLAVLGAVNAALDVHPNWFARGSAVVCIVALGIAALAGKP